jgi:hypothetical protein
LRCARVPPALYRQPFVVVGYEILMRSRRLYFLLEDVGTKLHGFQLRTGEIGAGQIAGCEPAKQCSGGHLFVNFRSAKIGKFIEISDRSLSLKGRCRNR